LFKVEVLINLLMSNMFGGECVQPAKIRRAPSWDLVVGEPR